MSEKIVLCACSGMNPRGEVARVSVYDLSVEEECFEYCCIVASGGNYQKFIDMARENRVIAVNGCENNCPETILKTKDASVEYNLNVSKLLKENNIPFEKQKTFKDCCSENNNLLRFDFWINNSFLLEFDGRQHFEGPEAKWKESLSLEEIQKRDENKNNYCKKNKIPLKRVPYFELTKLTIEDILSDKFLIKEGD